MGVKDISILAKSIGGVLTKNSPTILTGVAVTGVVTTVIFAVKATPKALLLIEEEKKHVQENTQLTIKDVVRIAWRCYIPAAGVGLVTIACIIGANKVNSRRNAALASLYSLTDTAFKEYRTKVAETIGRVKEQRVRDEIDADHINKNPSSSNEVIFTGKGEVMCYDSLTGRYFKGDIEHIRRITNELNRRLMTDMFIDLNELYYEVGLASTKLGSDLGFSLDDGLIEINFSSQLNDVGEPCLVLNYDVVPKFR